MLATMLGDLVTGLQPRAQPTIGDPRRTEFTGKPSLLENGVGLPEIWHVASFKWRLRLANLSPLCLLHVALEASHNTWNLLFLEGLFRTPSTAIDHQKRNEKEIFSNWITSPCQNHVHVVQLTPFGCFSMQQRMMRRKWPSCYKSMSAARNGLDE